MYKPKKGESTNRLRLDIESKLPSIFTIEHQFEEAKARRGCQIELPWHGSKPSQLFTLCVQWDTSADLPVWTLSEQNHLDSRMHWSEQYPPGDLQIMYDVVVMSVTNTDPAPVIKISDPPRPETQAPPPVPATQPPPYPPGGFMPGPGQMPYPVDPNMPGFAYPPYFNNPNMPYPPAWPPYGNIPPGMPSGVPQGVPPGMPPNMPGLPQGMPQGVPLMPPGMPPNMQGMPGMPLGGVSGQQPAVSPPINPAGSLPLSPPTDLPPPVPEAVVARSAIDYSLISKRAKVQLGKLLVDAKLISPSTLDAALKLQEMVEDGQVSADEAPSTLALHHTKGASIDQFHSQRESELVLNKEEQPRIGEIPETSKLPITPPKSAAEAKAAFDLLQKAVLLTEDDLKTAQRVRTKHGGDFIQILQHAGKLDKYTFESAVACLPLIQLGLMKVEQCIIALQYCNRMRVDFDTAVEELGWQNPRKMRKDLQL